VELQGVSLTRRACADARRGLAYNCAAVSERSSEARQVSPDGVHLLASGSGDRSETCRAARKALAFYRAAYRGWRAKMGAGQHLGRTYDATNRGVGFAVRHRACPRIRYLAARWKANAHAARLRYERWYRYHYAWREWLPDKWQRLGACETGYGKRPGNWRWNSGTYQGAFGFYYGSWDAFVPLAARKARPYPSEAYEATPRQQYEVALAIWRRYGFSGWGCRGA